MVHPLTDVLPTRISEKLFETIVIIARKTTNMSLSVKFQIIYAITNQSYLAFNSFEQEVVSETFFCVKHRIYSTTSTKNIDEDKLIQYYKQPNNSTFNKPSD